LAIWHSYEFSKVIRTHRKSNNKGTSPDHTISNRKAEVGMKVIEFVMSAVSVIAGWFHVATAE